MRFGGGRARPVRRTVDCAIRYPAGGLVSVQIGFVWRFLVLGLGWNWEENGLFRSQMGVEAASNWVRFAIFERHYRRPTWARKFRCRLSLFTESARGIGGIADFRLPIADLGMRFRFPRWPNLRLEEDLGT